MTKEENERIMKGVKETAKKNGIEFDVPMFDKVIGNKKVRLFLWKTNNSDDVKKEIMLTPSLVITKYKKRENSFGWDLIPCHALLIRLGFIVFNVSLFIEWN